MTFDPYQYSSYPQQQQAFDYSSAFSYRRRNRDLVEDDDGYDHDDPLDIGDHKRSNKTNYLEQSIYFLLVALSSLFFLITFPVSWYFCVKKVPSLQRCLTYRLGRRLPLKGPGFVFLLPFIDKASMIDLYENRFDLIEHEQQIMTGDGSIIQVQPCKATLNVTNALLTTLKINNINVKDFLRLRFGNLIRSKHVEDLENKMLFTLKQFEENMNEFLKKWGYAISDIEAPRVTVIDRADPINPIKKKLKKLLNPDENGSIESNDSFSNILGLFNNPEQSLASQSSYKNESHSAESLIPVLKSILNQYETYLRSYQCFNIKSIINDSQQVYYFQYQNETIKSSHIQLDPIHMSIIFKNQNDFQQFLLTKDIKYISFHFH